MFQVIFLYTKPNLNKLFKKWTIAVADIAEVNGKKRAYTGRRIVPSPKPEYRVMKPAAKETAPKIKISIF